MKTGLSDPLSSNATTSLGSDATTIDKGEEITPELTTLMSQFTYFYDFLTEKGDMLKKINMEISSMRQSAITSEDGTKDALAAMDEQMRNFSYLRSQYESSLSKYVDHEISKLNTSQDSIRSDIQAQETTAITLARNLVS